jgi:hypothetical protein
VKLRFLISASSVAVLAVSLAAPALASFDPHFKVLTKAVNGHELRNGGFKFYEKVMDPKRPQNKVGYDHGVCKPDGPVATFCKATFHLDGEIGGHGDIKVAGKLFQGQPTLEVLGGTDAFEGVEGTMTLVPSDLGNRYDLQIFDLH